MADDLKKTGEACKVSLFGIPDGGQNPGSLGTSKMVV